MRWSTCVKGAGGLLLAGLAGVVPVRGQGPGGPVPPQYIPYVAPALPYYQGYGNFQGYGYPCPGCPYPVLPYGALPPAMLPPGVAAPAAPSTTTPPAPGTTTPSRPGTTPSATEPSSGVTPTGGTADQSALANANAAAAAADGRSETGSGGGGERGSAGAASLAPNMFGDLFGGGRVLTTVPADRLALGPNSFLRFTTPGGVPLPGNQVVVLSDGRIQGVSPIGFRVTAGARSVNDYIAPISVFNNTVPQPTLARALGQFGIQIVGQFNNGSNFTSLNPVNLNTLRDNQVFPIASPSASQLQQLVPIFTGRTGMAGVPVFVPSASGAFVSQTTFPAGTVQRSIESVAMVDYLVTSEVQAPSSGGIVGRQKVSDDNSPFPRDRIIFNYDYYNSTPIGFRGADVHRFSPGFEITFFDQWASFEIRMPFAGTLSSTLLADGATPRQTVFGNVTTALKWLMFRSQCFDITGGCSFAFPTAPDQNINLSNGTPLAKFSNDSVVITPFVAAFLLPTDRLVLQAWWAVAYDTLGSGLYTNNGLGLQQVGTFREPALSQLDGQMSYWFFQNAGAWSWLTGLAGFLEIHNNTNLTHPSSLTVGEFRFSDGRKYNDLNLGAGLTFNFGDAAAISLGVVAPLRTEPNRGFDYQIGLRGSIFFGPTLRDRTGALLSTF
jgi:hypothetical protein